MKEVKLEIKRALFKIYSHIKYPSFMWRILNIKSILLFKKNYPKLNPTQKKILTELKETGIAVTSLEELFPQENLLEKLQVYTEKQAKRGEKNPKKTFLTDYWETCPNLTLENPFVALAFKPTILEIVNSYLKMSSRFLYLALQKTSPEDTSQSYSRSWHRDPQERRLCKVFIYLSDVDEETGPFVYIKNSVRGKKYGNFFPQKLPAGSYPDLEEFKKIIPQKAISSMVGKAGTVIFCDTTGLHYGGASRKHPRIMSTFVYAAPTYRENQSYRYNQSFKNNLTRISPATATALHPSWISKT